MSVDKKQRLEQYSRKINIVQLAFYDKLCNPYIKETHFMRKITRKKFYTSLFMSCISLFSACWLSGCEMIEYHPYDLDIDGETGINAKTSNALKVHYKEKIRSLSYSSATRNVGTMKQKMP